MNKKTILIIDDKPKNIEILVGGLINSQFQVVTADSGYDGLGKAHQIGPDLILINSEVFDLGGLQFLQRMKEEDGISGIPVVLLTTRAGVEDRMAAYEAGAKDYIIKPLHVSEIVARVRMILTRLDRRHKEREPHIGFDSGALDEKGLLDLIEDLFSRNFTGVLTLINRSKKSGQLFFSEGQVINAAFDDFRAERAVYQMIFWSEGEYDIATQDIDVEARIAIGNADLILESKKLLEKHRKLLLELPSPDACLTLSDKFLKVIEEREMSVEIMQFIDLFDGQRSVSGVVNGSKQDEVVALERIIKMYQQGFLSEVEEPTAEIALEDVAPDEDNEPIYSEKELELFQKRVFRSPDERKRLLVVVGTSTCGKSEFIQTLAGKSYRERSIKSIFPHPIDIGKFLASEELELTLFGIPAEKRLGLFLDSLEENMLGYVMIVNAVEPESFDYLGYLIKSFRGQYQLPYAVAITNLRHPQAIGIESLAQHLGVDDFEELVPCNPSDQENVKMVFLSMYSPFSSREYMTMPANIGEFSQ